MNLFERLSAPGPKRILSLDGGGIRGAITLGFLAKIEILLRERHQNPRLRLCDYFDLIGGTSTGAIIASGLAIGMEVEEIRKIYLDVGEKAFGDERKIRFDKPRFDQRELEKYLKEVFEDRTFDDPSLLTGLCVITKRADTGSVWPILNHPGSKYFDDNRGMLIREVIRASTAAPTYFEPQKLDVGGEVGAFIDGGVSMHNNPAFQLFLVATLQGFPFRWATGAEELLITSVGTGVWETRRMPDEVVDAKRWDWGYEVPNMLMNDANWQNQIIMQLLSRSPTPWPVDSEIGDLGRDLLGEKSAFSYLRYDVRLERNTLNSLGLSDLRDHIESLREMSNAENRHHLAKIGDNAAERDLKAEHFSEAFDSIYEALPNEQLECTGAVG